MPGTRIAIRPFIAAAAILTALAGCSKQNGEPEQGSCGEPGMIKLYKNTPDGTLYWETWENKGVHTVHWGKIGERGQSKQLQDSRSQNAQSLVESEMAQHRAEGYSERVNLAQIVIQYRIDGWGTQADFDKRCSVEDLMNETLGWTGLGHCDGGDIGSGSMNIFCYVVDLQAAVSPITADLALRGFLDGATIAAQDGDRYRVLWPKDFKGTFEIMYP